MTSPTHLSPDSRPTPEPDTRDAAAHTFQRGARHLDSERPRDTLAMSPLPESPVGTRSAMGLTFAQVAGSSLAAVSSALAASFLGVAGTIGGALVGSLVGTVGTAVYSHSLRTAGTRLRALTPAQKRALVETGGRALAEPREVHGPLRTDRPARRRPLLLLAAGVGVAFAVALGAITLAEKVLGHPVSSSSGGGTTIGRVVTPESPATGSPGNTPSPAPASATTAPTAPSTTSPTTEPTGSGAGSGTSSGTTTSTGSASTTPAPTGSATTQPPALP